MVGPVSFTDTRRAASCDPQLAGIALRFQPASAGLFSFRFDMPVEHGQLIDKPRLAGAYVVCLLGISGQDREGWLVQVDGLLTLGIAPLGQLQQGVVSVVLHRGSPASGTSGVYGLWSLVLHSSLVEHGTHVIGIKNNVVTE